MITKIALILLFFSVGIYGSDIDSIFLKAKDLSQKGNYKEALFLCDSIQKMRMNDVDLLLFKGLLWSWSHQCDSAASYLIKARSIAVTYKDVHKALINLWKWCNQQDSLNKAMTYAQSVFPDDPVFRIKDSNTRNSGRDKLKQVSTIFLNADMFGIHGPPKPWEQLDFYHKLKFSRLSIIPSVKISRRWYGDLLMYGAEGRVEAIVEPVKQLSIKASVYTSPYKLFDTLFPAFSIISGLSFITKSHLENSVEFVYRDYGKASSYSFNAASVLYLKQITFSAAMWLAPWESRVYISGVVGTMLTSRKNEHLSIGLKGGMGKGPPDAGSPDYATYIFTMGQLYGSIPINKKLSIMPFMEIRKEQYGYSFPYIHYSCGTGIKYLW